MIHLTHESSSVLDPVVSERSRGTKLYGLLKLFLGAELVGVTAFLLAAILRTRRQPRVALPADHLLTIIRLGQRRQRRIVHHPSLTPE